MQEEFIKALEERGFELESVMVATREYLRTIGKAKFWVWLEGELCDVFVEDEPDTLCDIDKIPYAKALPLIDALIGVLS